MLVFEHLDVEDGGPTAGRSGKLTTGNINWNIMFHLIFRAATDRPVAEPLTGLSTPSTKGASPFHNRKYLMQHYVASDICFRIGEQVILRSAGPGPLFGET